MATRSTVCRFTAAILFVLSTISLQTGCKRASVIAEFKSDGCSMFPDGTLKNREKWLHCCVNHDKAYWRGGTKAERKTADKALRVCVTKATGSPDFGALMYTGVRAGGSAYFPTWYRWGYGWSYGRGYTPLTEEERKQTDSKLPAP